MRICTASWILACAVCKVLFPPEKESILPTRSALQKNGEPSLPEINYPINREAGYEEKIP